MPNTPTPPSNRYAMIMAGGGGTRLWPMSRAQTPKQLVPMIGGESLLQLAAARLEGLIPNDRRMVCAAETWRDGIRGALPALADANWIGEPMGRDTVNAVALTAAILAKRDPNAVFAVLTADHVIEPVGTFQQCIDHGFRLAEADPSRLITFAITPTFPATQYGYVEYGESIPGNAPAVRCARFVEKPDAPQAKEYLESGRFGWNSGMFVFHAQGFLDALRRFHPNNHAGILKIQSAWDTPEQSMVLAAVYPTLPKISVDYAIMEPASQDTQFSVATVPMAVSWKDVGSWSTYATLLSEDPEGNRATGESMPVGCKDTMVVNRETGHLVCAVGCEGLVIVHTPEATLIMPAAMSERVKELVNELPPEWR